MYLFSLLTNCSLFNLDKTRKLSRDFITSTFPLISFWKVCSFDRTHVTCETFIINESKKRKFLPELNLNYFPFIVLQFIASCYNCTMVNSKNVTNDNKSCIILSVNNQKQYKYKLVVFEPYVSSFNRLNVAAFKLKRILNIHFA